MRTSALALLVFGTLSQSDRALATGGPRQHTSSSQTLVGSEERSFVWRDLNWSIPASFFAMPFDKNARFLELGMWWSPGFFQTRGPSIGASYVRIVVDDLETFDPDRYTGMRAGDHIVRIKIQGVIGARAFYIGAWGSTYFFKFPTWTHGPRPLLLSCTPIPNKSTDRSFYPRCKLLILTIQGVMAEVTVPNDVHGDIVKFTHDVLALMERFTIQGGSFRGD